MSQVDSLKADLAAAIRLLTAQGLMDFNGHMSCRLPETDRVLINSRQASRSGLRTSDIATIDLEGRLLESGQEPPSESPIHTCVYRARPDVSAVAHLHPQVATVFSIAQRPLVPVFILGSLFQREGVPVYDDPDLIRSREQGERVAQTLGTGRAVLLRGHGAVIAGEDVASCFAASIWLEENAKKQLWASGLGSPRIFTEDECRRVRSSLWRPETVRKTWDYYVAKGRADGVLDPA